MAAADREPTGLMAAHGTGPAARHGTGTRSAIFAPLEDVGRAVRVEHRLAEAIRSGVLRDGERLPSEAELAASGSRPSQHERRWSHSVLRG